MGNREMNLSLSGFPLLGSLVAHEGSSSSQLPCLFRVTPCCAVIQVQILHLAHKQALSSLAAAWYHCCKNSTIGRISQGFSTMYPPNAKLLGLLASLLTTSTALAVVPCNVSSDGNTYDYIIVGGGLSGLVVANRLTEHKNGMYNVVLTKSHTNIL